MATQRFTLAKLAGASGTSAAELLRGWASRPDVSNQQIEAFANRLRENAADPAVAYFCEWFDHWSMAFVFDERLPVSEGSGGLAAKADPFEIRCYQLPDGGALAARLPPDPAWSQEENWLIARLREAVEAWDKLAPEATLILIREMLDASTLDEEMKAALARSPEWFADLR